MSNLTLRQLVRGLWLALSPTNADGWCVLTEGAMDVSFHLAGSHLSTPPTAYREIASSFAIADSSQ